MGPRLLAAIAIALSLSACGGSGSSSTGGPSFSGAPLLTTASDSGALTVALRSNPTPPTRGISAFQLTLTDAAGKPASGLALGVQPWMPAMGHGTSIVPAVEETAPGVYDVTNVVLVMPGTWQLRTSISGARTDSFSPAFQIP